MTRAEQVCISCGGSGEMPAYPGEQDCSACGGTGRWAAQHRYGFSLWPSEQGAWEPSMFDAWRAGNLDRRIEMEMTVDEWTAFSSSLERQGITLREVEVQFGPDHCPLCWHAHLGYDDEPCVSCGCDGPPDRRVGPADA